MRPPVNGSEAHRCGRTRFILVRHGQSNFNLLGRIQGCSDEPSLTDLGRSTADRVAAYLRRASITRIVTSPLRRAREFAGRVRTGLDKSGFISEIARDERLREIDLPLWEGLEIGHVQRTEPASYRLWQERPDRFVMGSTLRPVIELYARAASFWRDAEKIYRGETLLVVTHSGTARALVGAALGISPAHFHSHQQSNGGVTILDLAEQTTRGYELVCLNATRHLGQGLPKLKQGRQGFRLLLFARDGGGRDTFDEFRSSLKEMPAREDRTGVQTLTILAESSEVRRRVAQALGGTATDPCFRNLALGVSVLHYVSQDAKPVVQAIELAESQVFPAGSQVRRCS